MSLVRKTLENCIVKPLLISSLALTPFLIPGCGGGGGGGGGGEASSGKRQTTLQEKLVQSGLERPDGIHHSAFQILKPMTYKAITFDADGNQTEQAVKPQLAPEGETIFAEEPTFIYDAQGNLAFRTLPKIRTKDATLFTNFPDPNAWAEGLVTYTDDAGNPFFRSRGLQTDTLVLPDGTILVLPGGISNNNNIYFLNPDQTNDAYNLNTLTDDELTLTTNMVRGADGLVYLAQPGIKATDRQDRQARIITLNPTTKEIRIFADLKLPSRDWEHVWNVPPTNLTYGNGQYPFGERLRIAQNPDGGFYLIDFLGKGLYELKDKNLSSLLGLKTTPPIDISTDGKEIYIFTAPILKSDNTLERPAQFLRFDPKKAEENWHSLDMKGLDLRSEAVMRTDAGVPKTYSTSSSYDPTNRLIDFADSYRGQRRQIILPEEAKEE